MKKKQPEFRSGYERKIAADLDKRGEKYEYEVGTFSIELPASRGHVCGACKSKAITQTTRYTPDFRLKSGVYVEAKGRFTGRDRKKVLAMIAQYPHERLHLLFMRDNRLSKSSKTTYSEWCKMHEVPYAIGAVIPEAWT